MHPLSFVDELTPPPRLVLSASYLAEARLLNRSQWYSREQLDELKLKRLVEMCQYAHKYCPYYTRKFDEYGFDPQRMSSPDDLLAIPPMDKADLQQHLGDIVSRAIPDERCEHLTSGGSTGTPVGLYLEKGVTYERTYAYERRQFKWGGVGAFERRASLRARLFAAPIVRRFNNLYLSTPQLSPVTVKSYVDELAAYSPTYLEAFPSAARFLAEWILCQPSPPRFPKLKAVFLSSETTSDTDRMRIEQAFGSPVYTKYGNTEQVTIIGQCDHGTLHEFEEYSYTEYLPVDPSHGPEGTAEIVGTGFVNRATPLIRYRTEDLVVLSSGSCACGRALRPIRAVLGREQDYLLGIEGEILTNVVMTSHSNAFEGIAQYQYYQESPGAAVIRLVPIRPLSEEQKHDIVAEAQRLSSGRIRFTLEVVQDLDRTERGKNRFIVRTCSATDR